MKHNKSLFMCCLLLILSVSATTAQPYAQHVNAVRPYLLPSYDYVNQMITLRSDLPSQSVLVSNLIADKAGDMSPIIGGVIWSEGGRQLECRSLLKFNFNFLPGIIIEDPSLITSAQLVLYPLQFSFSPNDIDKPAKFIVRRILDNWVDTTTTWINQPAADSTIMVSKLIKIKNKDYPVSVDVTKLVIKMIKSGNNGFMIYPDNSGQQPMASGQVFASPKYAFEELRPLLIIDYRGMTKTIFGFSYWDQQIQTLPYTEKNMLIQSTSGPVMEPVIQPVTEPIKTNPVKD